MAESKGKYMSTAQKKMLVQLVKNETELLSGKFSSTFTYKAAQEKWIKIGATLNSIPGAQKEWKHWRKTWHDIPSKTKSKNSALKRYECGTGGGPPCPDDINSTDEEILEVICPTSVTRHTDTQESQVDFSFDDEGASLLVNVGTAVSDTTDTTVTNIETNSQKIEAGCSFSTPKPPKKIKYALPPKRLERSVHATEIIAENTQRELKMKQNYYNQKIQLMERQTTLFERLVVAVESICHNDADEDV
ncbi:hypothetical protein RI129_002729 [Pyrocoelia pectoralis]|uniref:Regulatory protein zeste n=1 Tax=Pyrocoelia pectoralis TaxID=417401 RepID=A0AAN7ZLU7_9COLE